MSRVDAIRLEMAAAIRELGGEHKADAAVFHAAYLIGLPVAVVKRLYWKKIRRPAADIVDPVREARDRLKAERRAALDAKAAGEARNEFAELSARIARVEALFLPDEEFGRAHVDALRAVARRPNSSVDSGEAE